MEKQPFNFKSASPSWGICRSQNMASSIQIKLTGELTTCCLWRISPSNFGHKNFFWPQEPLWKQPLPFFPRPECDSCTDHKFQVFKWKIVRKPPEKERYHTFYSVYLEVSMCFIGHGYSKPIGEIEKEVHVILFLLDWEEIDNAFISGKSAGWKWNLS